MCVFAFISEIASLSGGSNISIDSWTKLNTFMIEVMRNVIKPFNFSEATNNSYFEIFYSTLDNSPKMFASAAG